MAVQTVRPQSPAGFAVSHYNILTRIYQEIPPDFRQNFFGKRKIYAFAILYRYFLFDFAGAGGYNKRVKLGIYAVR